MLIKIQLLALPLKNDIQGKFRPSSSHFNQTQCPKPCESLAKTPVMGTILHFSGAQNLNYGFRLRYGQKLEITTLTILLILDLKSATEYRNTVTRPDF